MTESIDQAQSRTRSHWWANPAVVAGLWLLATGLHAFDQIRFPPNDDPPYVSSILYLSAAPVLAALFAASISGLRDRALALAGLLLLVDCVTSVCWLVIQWRLDGTGIEPEYVAFWVALIALGASLWLIGRAARSGATTRIRRALAILAGLLVLTGWPSISLLDGRFLALSAKLSTPTPSDDDVLLDIDEERLWTSQPSLVANALSQLGQSPPTTETAYLVTVGAGGSQDLFGREARVARDTLGRAFGAEQRSVLLANDEDSLYRVPLAANSNLDAVLAALGRKIHPSRDLVILYLTSHGSRDAELMTDLPDYRDLEAIGAQRLGEELKRAGIRRRVIIVSACYAGGWIKPLATDDTIVIAAARADRNSFGCSDERKLTYFGEAFLTAPVRADASLEERFNMAKRTVAKWEAASAKLPSEPQAFVGKNMTAVWKARLSAAARLN